MRHVAFVCLTVLGLMLMAALSPAAGLFSPESLGRPDSWEPQPSWLSARSENFRVISTDEGLDFIVPEGGRGMKWTTSFNQTVSVDDTPYLVLIYRCRNYFAGADYLLWIKGSKGGEGLRILKNEQIKADGQWHTIALDLLALGVDSCQQMALQCFATEAGDAHLTVARLEFAESAPEGAEMLPRTTGEGLKATFAFNDPAAWTAQPAWLSNPTERPAVTRTEEGLRFSVPDMGFGMKWSCDLAEQLPGGYFKLRYRARGLELRRDYVLYAAVSGGGKSEQEQYVFYLNDLVPDGDWHTLTALYAADFVKTLAVQVQAREPDAWLEISSLEIWGRRPETKLTDVCPYRASWPAELGPFKPLALTTGEPFSELQRALRMVGWFESPRVSVRDVPFDVSSGLGLLSGSARVGFLETPLKGRWRQLYLLLGARLPSTEQPSYAFKPASVERYPHRFITEVVYADGGSEQQMPTRLSTGRAEVSAGLAVYALAVDPNREVDALRLYDGHRQGTFALVAVTPSTADGPATAATKPQPASLLRPAERADDVSRVRKSADGSLLLDSGALHAEFVAGPSLALRRLTSDYVKGVNTVVEGGALFSVSVGETAVTSDQARVTRVSIEGRSAVVDLDLRPKLPMTAQLAITAGKPDEMRLDLSLEPAGKAPAAEPVVELPVLIGGRAGRDPRDTWVFFPRRGTVISNEPTGASLPYGGMFPLQVLGFFSPTGGGLYLRTEYQEVVDRRYCLQHGTDGVSMSVRYPWWRGQKLNAFVGTNPGDWHDQLRAYNEWRETWFKPAAPRKDWFRRIFNFRQQFLHFALPTKSGMFDPETKSLRLREVLESDAKAFGGCDYLHLFDWGWSPETGRCGDYAPWDYLGGVDRFRQAIEDVQKMGVPVGLYIEGYLISPQSKLFERAKAWQVIKSNGEPLEAFAPDINICPWVKEWQDYLPATYARARQQTGASGFYIDEYGFAHDGHACYSADHGHPAPAFATEGELQMTQKVRAALGPDAALYTEESPCDLTMQWQDGAFTYAISSVSDELSPHHLNLVRFAVPDFKTIEIITCDHPLGDNLEALKQILFNGEAIWLEGIPDRWFDERALAYIGRMHAVLRDNADCFTSLRPEALVPTLWADLYANRFPSDDRRRCAWTIYWTGPRTLTADLMRVPHREGVAYRDVFDGRTLTARRDGAEDVLSATLHPHEVLVVVQEPAG